MERVEAWVTDQRAASEEAEERARLAREETERAERKRLDWEGRRRGSAAKKEKKPPKERLVKRLVRAVAKLFRHDATKRGKQIPVASIDSC